MQLDLYSFYLFEVSCESGMRVVAGQSSLETLISLLTSSWKKKENEGL